jgi:hypothetical protein
MRLAMTTVGVFVTLLDRRSSIELPQVVSEISNSASKDLARSCPHADAKPGPGAGGDVLVVLRLGPDDAGDAQLEGAAGAVERAFVVGS